jgi:hypothetical protein
MRRSDVSIAAVERMKTGSRLPPNYSISHSIIGAPAREPRRAEDALGPLGADLPKRIGADTYEAWLGNGKVRVISRVDDTLRLAVSSRFVARNPKPL